MSYGIEKKKPQISGVSDSKRQEFYGLARDSSHSWFSKAYRHMIKSGVIKTTRTAAIAAAIMASTLTPIYGQIANTAGIAFAAPYYLDNTRVVQYTDQNNPNGNTSTVIKVNGNQRVFVEFVNNGTTTGEAIVTANASGLNVEMQANNNGKENIVTNNSIYSVNEADGTVQKVNVAPGSQQSIGQKLNDVKANATNANVIVPPQDQQQSTTTYSQQTTSPNTTVLMTFGSNPVTYGFSTTATAVCPATDTCTVQQPLGTILATGEGTATYNILPGGAGFTTFYAVDKSTGQTAAGTLTTAYPSTITPNTPNQQTVYVPAFQPNNALNILNTSQFITQSTNVLTIYGVIYVPSSINLSNGPDGVIGATTPDGNVGFMLGIGGGTNGSIDAMLNYAAQNNGWPQLTLSGAVIPGAANVFAIEFNQNTNNVTFQWNSASTTGQFSGFQMQQILGQISGPLQIAWGSGGSGEPAAQIGLVSGGAILQAVDPSTVIQEALANPISGAALGPGSTPFGPYVESGPGTELGLPLIEAQLTTP